MSDLQLTRENSLKLKEELLRTATEKAGNKKMMNPLKLPEIFNYFDTPGREKKWTAPNADITDYFNYGLTEDTFKIYAQKVKNLFTKLQKTGGAHFKNMGEASDKFFEDRLPISHGGLEIIDDKALKDYQEDITNILYYENDKYLEQIFTSQDHAYLDAVRKGIYEINGSVNNIYGLKKDPPPNPPTPLLQPPPAMPNMPAMPQNTFGLSRPQPPQPVPPRRANPTPPAMPMPNMPSMPSMPNMPNMYPPPMHPHPMDYSGYAPHMMNRPPGYMGNMPGMPGMGNMAYPPKNFDFNPMYPPGGMMMGRPHMEMPEGVEMEDKRYEKKRRDSSSSESSDEAEKTKHSKEGRKKRSRSKEKKHKHHRSDKDNDHFESKHHHKDRHDREDKSSRRRGNSKEREREEVKYEGSYQQSNNGQDKGPDGRDRRGAWQKGYINNLIGGQGKEGGRDRKDKRSK